MAAVHEALSIRRAVLWAVVVSLCAVIASVPVVGQGDTSAPTPSITLAPSPSPTPASTPVSTCGPRVRRGWATMVASDKQLYLDAVMKAMSTGLHTFFHEVHADTDSGNEAHLTCGMIYWHRRFILAYENMLRSLEPRFACLTVPYWDYFADFTKRTTGFCTSLEGCSTFLTDFGGSFGPVETHELGGTNITSNCVTAGVVPGTNLTFSNATYSTNYTVETRFNMSGFCQSSSTPASNCTRCMPRGSWTTTPFPSGFGYASLAKLISGSFGFSNFAQNLHYGVHNSIHNAAGSTMATLSTSADPIFYNHHSMIDLVHQMWYDCQVKRPMTEYEKKNSNYAYAMCTQSNGVTCPSRLANITQYWTNGTDRVRADDHPVLGQFFSPLPIEYWRYVSGSDLGDYSYTYITDGLLQSFADAKTAITCPATSKARRIQEIASDRRLATKTDPRLPLINAVTSLAMRLKKLVIGMSDSGSTAIKTPTAAPTAAPTVAPTAAPTAAATVVPQGVPTPGPTPAPSPSPTTAAPTLLPREDPVSIASPTLGEGDLEDYLNALEQMTLMECAWYVEQGGFIVDWTDDYKRNMNMNQDAHSPEYFLIMKLISGELKIDLENWREVFKAYLQVGGSSAIPVSTSASGVNQPIGLEAVLDPKTSTTPGLLTEEAGVVSGDAIVASDTGVVKIDKSLMVEV